MFCRWNIGQNWNRRTLWVDISCQFKVNAVKEEESVNNQSHQHFWNSTRPAGPSLTKLPNQPQTGNRIWNAMRTVQMPRYTNWSCQEPDSSCVEFTRRRPRSIVCGNSSVKEKPGQKRSVPHVSGLSSSSMASKLVEFIEDRAKATRRDSPKIRNTKICRTEFGLMINHLERELL